MRIFLQDRQRIAEMPREIWIADNVNEFWIIGTTHLNGPLGRYKTHERAQEVFRQIFESYRNGKKSYIMPEE